MREFKQHDDMYFAVLEFLYQLPEGSLPSGTAIVVTERVYVRPDGVKDGYQELIYFAEDGQYCSDTACGAAICKRIDDEPFPPETDLIEKLEKLTEKYLPLYKDQ